MKTKLFSVIAIILALIFSNSTSAQTLYNVKLGTDNKKITEVQIEFNGSTLTQSSGYGTNSAPSARQTSLAVNMNYVKINDGSIKTLNFFNEAGAYVTNNNFTTSATGVGVYNMGNETLVSNGVAAWEEAMQDMVKTRNALHYLFYDGTSNIPSGSDFDILWARALTNADYFVVSERNGNTNFSAVPLDINGNIITSARELKFGAVDGTQSPDGNTKYDWNIGYGSAGRNANQPQYFTVVDVDLFNTTQAIYGLRIDNLGDADVKFYGLSDDTFTNNPRNPNVPGLVGKVFIDTNGLNDNTVNGTGISTPNGTQLYASLLNNSNAILATVAIANDGSYEFLNIKKNSTYTVVIHTNPAGSTTANLPSGWINTGENVGVGTGSDGTVNGVLTASVTTVVRENVNFGIKENLGSIGDTVWYDTNGDGVIDIPESPLQGATVTLDPGTPSNTSDDLTTTTDANGQYLFDNLSAGNYAVSVDVSTVTNGLPNGVLVSNLIQTYDADGISSANKSDVTLATGENNLDQDFGYQDGSGSIGDIVWYDANGDGVIDMTDSPLEGATVILDPGTPSNAGDDVNTTTNGNGEYLFDNLPAGNYTVTVDVSSVTNGLPIGVTVAQLSQTYDADGIGTANKSSLTLAVKENNLDQDFGYISCPVATNTTSSASITDNETKTLSGSPSGGTWSIVSGVGSIVGTTYTPASVTSNTTVVIRYTIAASPGCSASTADVTFTVTPSSNPCTDGAIFGTPTANDPDADGINNICDEDDDNDGILDMNEYSCTNAPLGSVDSFIIENETQTQTSVNVSSFSNSSSPFASNANYTLNYGVNTGKRLEGIYFSSGKTIRVDPVAEKGKVYIRRNTASSNPNNEIIWIENNGHTSTSNATKLHTKQVSSMEESFSHGYYNVGSDNVFNNNASSANKNNVERIDVIFDTGYEILSAENQFITVGERGKNNFIDIAVVTGIDSNGTPISFSTVYRVTTSSMETLQKIPSTVLRKEATDTNFRPSTALNQDVAIRAVKLSEFNIANGTIIYGFSILPPDYNTGNILDWTTYPTNTNESTGGLDLVLFNYFSSDCFFEDTDKDGIPNTQDPDSDGDGCPDVLESGGTDANNDGVLDGTSIDANGKVVGGNGGYDGATGNEYVAHQLGITTAPSNVTANSGDSASFSVVASAESATDYNNGTPVYGNTGNANSGIRYQWYLGDPLNGGSALTDAGVYSNTTTATLTISDVTGLGGNEYYVVITHDNNTCAKEISSATLSVTSFASIGDTVWYDTDGDGIVDSGEPRLEGATITLDPGTQNDPSDDITTTTDANGNYLFDNLQPGNYLVSVDISTVISGVPTGKTVADLVQTFDADGLGSPNKSYVTLVQGENNLDQDFAYIVPSGGTTGGNSGGVESESLGDAISKIYVDRKKNSVPTEFVKDKSNLYNKSSLQAKQPYRGKGQTMLDMFPTELMAGNVANVTSPTDILDYTIADEVLSVDFSLDGKTKGVVLGIKTSDKVYNHTKASCDRLRGAEILNVMPLQIEGYNFLMQGIKQRNGVIEYAVSFAAAKNNNDANYSIQTNWYVNEYIKFNDMYNFQVWTTKPTDTQKLVADIIKNLKSFIPVNQIEKQKIPTTYASKIYRDKSDLIIALRSTTEGAVADISMIELYSETANNIKHRYNSISTEIQQSLRVAIADGYEYDGLIESKDIVQDAFYHADGNWGLDFDKRYTTIKNYFVWNNFNREYVDDEYTINRNVELKATSEYDYLTLYKSLLPGTISADYSEYKYLAFTAKGSGLMELGLVKSSIQDWKQQYRIMVDLSEEERTYYVPFEAFSSVGTQESINANDLTTLTFTFLPVEANTKELDLFISDVKFTKTAIDDLIVNKIEKFENEFMAYPNPSKGNVNILLFSEVDTEAEVILTDITGKTIYRGKTQLSTGKNELEYNFKSLKTGMYLLKVASKESDYGTSKIIFR